MPHMSRTKAATLGLLAPAALALGMSADTSFRFLGDALNITNDVERALLCGVAEAAIVALTVYAWATRTKGPAYLAYAAVLVQAIPAFQVSGGVGGPVRVVLGPVLLAVMLHLLLGLELRMSGEKSDGLIGAALRELRERLTASLGIGRRGADSAAIARSRAADRAVDLADRVAAASEGSRKRSRRAAKLAAAIDAARHGLDPADADAAEAAIVSRVVRRKSVAGLATIATRHDWTATLPAPRHDTDRDTATTPVTVDRDTDRDTATPQVATATADRDTEAAPAAPAPAAAVPGVVDLMTKRQTATSRERVSGLETSGSAVVGDTITTTPAPAPSVPTAGDATPSVAQMVREAMTAGVTDRDTVLARVRAYRPETTRQTVARAMQRQSSKLPATDQGQYL
ncbi:hypothetical protein AQI94_42140 [Streptomyces pseudovenezuelae]|uniref:Conjugal transfer protein n=3 Tax=Kitasatosporales TaxID=85011 RepID=A0A124H8B9_9ACTN|nr:hypothetical protein AQI94_42140 [Streptomyces pseudovenezuelae]